MKKITLIMAGIISCALLAGCGGNTVSGSDGSSASESNSKTPAEKTTELLAAVEFPSMVELTADDLSARYDIEADKLTAFSAYICGSGAMPDEFGVFEAADSDTAAAIKTSLDERVKKQRDSYADYKPDEMYKFDDCFVTQKGTMVIYAICADNSAAADILG